MNWLTLSLFAAPLALTAAAILGLREPGLRPRRVLWASGAATVFSLGLACAAAVFLALNGPATSPVIGLHGVGFAIRIDALSAVLFALVSFVGVVVVRFSRNYMDGDARQGAFAGGLCLTLASVMTASVRSGTISDTVPTSVVLPAPKPPATTIFTVSADGDGSGVSGVMLPSGVTGPPFSEPA